jgi:hypothetical protein
MLTSREIKNIPMTKHMTAISTRITTYITMTMITLGTSSITKKQIVILNVRILETSSRKITKVMINLTLGSTKSVESNAPRKRSFVVFKNLEECGCN